ncbi:MAG: hypothetical protein HYZ58_19525, partial [Acidobacteria bacterium]|nr:hypothetical protein [Acidobacteriota bacterium]
GGGLFFQSSFDYQWRDELRNANGRSTSPLASDPIAIAYNQTQFAYPSIANRQNNSNWQGHVLGRYVFPYGIGFATNLRAQSGFNYVRVIQASLPNAGAVSFFAENIEGTRSDTTPLLDFRVDKSFKVDRYRLTLMADLFNSLNSNAVTNFFLNNGANYNRIIATLDPRTAMLGARFEF